VFYEKLKIACAENGTSPTALAKKLCISTGNTGRWERGKVPGGDILQKMAQELGVTTDYLLGIDKPTAPEGELGREVVARAMTEIEGLSDDQVREVIRYAAYIKTRQNE